MRTAGALLLLLGAVALVDHVLPGSTAQLGLLPAAAQLGIGAGAFAIGAILFFVGRRWR